MSKVFTGESVFFKSFAHIKFEYMQKLLVVEFLQTNSS